MLATRPLLRILEAFPVLLDGRTLHHAGLAALAAGEAARAERLLECAALRYRRELAVEALARVRVHQLIARARAGGGGLELDIERQLYRLGAIESLEPPFEAVDARRLLAAWDDTPRRAAA